MKKKVEPVDRTNQPAFHEQKKFFEEMWRIIRRKAQSEAEKDYGAPGQF